MKTSILLSFVLTILFHTAMDAQSHKLTPITKSRVNIQSDSAKTSQIIDGKWVAVGVNTRYSIQHDYTLKFNGKPSYRFELKSKDNTLKGYKKGSTKGRAELSYCYATSVDFDNFPDKTYRATHKMKTVYFYGKGITPQGSSSTYTFSVYIPSTLPDSVKSIFAQWHGMPSRRLVSTPDGEVKKLSVDEFISMHERMIFKKNIAHHKILKINKDGQQIYMAGKPNGWLIEQGGYPPLAFGISNGFFYIKANSDRKWLTDKTDRCNANPADTPIMQPVTSIYKASTIAYKEPFKDFPKDQWITFNIDIDWTVYGKESNQILKPGKLDIKMKYLKNGKELNKHIVDNEEILIGRNDDTGYYFKFGIYRVGDSKVPVVYNLAGYEEMVR